MKVAYTVYLVTMWRCPDYEHEEKNICVFSDLCEAEAYRLRLQKLFEKAFIFYSDFHWILSYDELMAVSETEVEEYTQRQDKYNFYQGWQFGIEHLELR